MTIVNRLKDLFVPTHYDLRLTLDRENRRFEGTVAITGTATTADTPLKVHAKDLTIVSATIDGAEASHELGSDDELSVTTPTLTAGDHVLSITFTGTITDQMHGLYPCYFEHDGVKKQLLATQFESHHAREVFPCVDEPAAKATFDLTLVTETGVQTLSNMGVKTQAEDAGSLVTTFDTTPRMSTYLLAFVVGELHKKTATTKDGVEVNVWATPAQPATSLDFALDTAVRAIEFYDGYFGTKYPLPVRCDGHWLAGMARVMSATDA